MQDEPETTTNDPQSFDFDSPIKNEREVDYDPDGAAKRLMEKCVEDARNNTARLDRDRSDWLNLLFERGGADNHYVIWDAGTNRWVTRGTDPKKGGLPEWMPRPVTNLFANKIDGIVAILDQSQPAQIWKPNTDDDDDLATADVCDNALPVLREEIDYDQLNTDINRQITLTDKIAIVLYYDNDEKYGMQDVRAQQCMACAMDPSAEESLWLPMDMPEGTPDGECPNCGGPLQEASYPDTGEPIGVPYPVGKMCASFHPSFEFSLPRSARSHRADKNPWILFHSRYAWEDAINEFKDADLGDLKGKSGWKSSSVQRQYADAMRKLSGPRSSSQTGGGSDQDGPIIYRLYHDPIDDGEFYFPDGLYAVMVNDRCIEAGPLAFKQALPNGTVRHFKNVITRTYRATPGSAFGKPPADDMVSLQYTRNLLEALLMAILLHHASPRTYLPLSVSLEKPITGVPGEVIPFRSTVPGEVPVTTQGQNPPEGLFKWIEQIDQKFDTLSKLNAVLQGERPAGDPTLGEVEILKEQGQSAFTEPLLEKVRFEKTLSRMLLWIARDTIWTDRLRQVQGENKSWEISQFTAADLSGNVDVECDPATAWPKSALMEKLQLRELMEMGIFQMLAVQPELATKILEKYGATEFLPSLDVDRRQIMRVLDAWRAATNPGEIAPPDPVLHNLPLHLLYKLAFLKTEEYEALQRENGPLAMAMRSHVEAIQQTLAMQAAAAAAAANPQPQKEPNGPSGDALHGAVESGALTPASAANPGLTVQDALAQGVLQPAGAADAAAQAALPSIDQLIAANAIAPAPPEGAQASPGGMPGL